MSDIKRYSNELRHGNFKPLVEKADGGYVLHSDYATLLARVARLEEALNEISTLYWVDALPRKKCAGLPVVHWRKNEQRIKK